MSKTPRFDQKVQAILEATTPGERVCELTGEKWQMTDEEIGWYKKFNVPPSKYSPLTRLRLLTAFFVGFQWWNNKSAKDGKILISSTHPASGAKVVSDEDWFSSDYSSTFIDPDSVNSVFAAVQELRSKIPSTANRNFVPPVNSICTISSGDEDSYFVNACRSKRTLFAMNALDSEDCAEIYQSSTINQSYHLVHCERIFNSRYLQESRDCVNCQFLFDCRNCEDCFLCTNQRNKRFCFRNEQLNEEEYRRRVSEINTSCRSSIEPILQEFDQLVGTKAIWPENFSEDAPDSSGEYVMHSSACHECYWVSNQCQNIFQSGFTFNQSSDDMNTVGWFTSTNSYYSSIGSKTNNAKFCYTVVQCQNCEYCYHCYNCEDCFGCVGLQRKRFCIFNKQYSEEEYWKVLDEIKCKMLESGEYGEFFPARLSPTRFMDSGATLMFLADEKTRDEFQALNYPPESAGASGEDRVPASELQKNDVVPDCLDDPALDALIGKPLYDEKAARRFVILPQEVDLYRKLKVAPAKDHFVARVRDLAFRANGGEFMQADCQKCQKELTVAKNRKYPERTIYCRDCYLQYMEKNS